MSIFRPATLRALHTTRVLRDAAADAKRDHIIGLLERKFTPQTLRVQDVSGGCGAFYAIQITSSAFRGMSTVQAHRAVNRELKSVIADIHGLQVRVHANSSKPARTRQVGPTDNTTYLLLTTLHANEKD